MLLRKYSGKASRFLPGRHLAVPSTTVIDISSRSRTCSQAMQTSQSTSSHIGSMGGHWKLMEPDISPVGTKACQKACVTIWKIVTGSDRSRGLEIMLITARWLERAGGRGALVSGGSAHFNF